MDDQCETDTSLSEDPVFLEVTTLSRRCFLKAAILGTASGLLYSMGTKGCASLPAQKRAIAGHSDPVEIKARPQPAIGHVSRVSVDESACASCGICSLVCAAVHGNTVGPSSASIWLERKPFECNYISMTCQQCDAPECYYACETGAFYINPRTGARMIDGSKCIGCKRCIEACVFEEPRILFDSELGVAFKCDLCSGRPEGPACVEFCPRQALKLTAKEASA